MDERGALLFGGEASRLAGGRVVSLVFAGRIKTTRLLRMFQLHLAGEFDQGIERVHGAIIGQMF